MLARLLPGATAQPRHAPSHRCSLCRHHPCAGRRDGAARQPQRQGVPRGSRGHPVGTHVDWIRPHAGVSGAAACRTASSPPPTCDSRVPWRRQWAGRAVCLDSHHPALHRTSMLPCPPTRLPAPLRPYTVLHARRVDHAAAAPLAAPPPCFFCCLPTQLNSPPSTALGRLAFDAHSQPKPNPRVGSSHQHPGTPQNFPGARQRSALQQHDPVTLRSFDGAPIAMSDSLM